MKRFFLSLICLTNLLAPLKGWAQVSDVIQSNNQFAFDLLWSPKLAKGNLFFSPLSLSAALSMASAGARGETEQQMKQVLHLPEQPHPLYQKALAILRDAKGVELSIANRIWAEKSETYESAFLGLVKENYQANLGMLDFRKSPEPARKEINQWVSEQTKTKIPELLKVGTIDKNTEMVLTNAVYFKGQWKERFEKSETKKDKFFASTRDQVSASYMHKSAKFGYAESSEYQLVQMMYEGSEVAFVAVLPREGLELSKFKLADWQKLSAEIAQVPGTVDIPKFKSSSALELSEILGALGMKLAFDKEKADFSGLRKPRESENIALSKVIHQAIVDVNEEGTEAAAATAVVAVRVLSARPMKNFVMKLNRPFLYAITHPKTEAILFLGRFEKP